MKKREGIAKAILGDGLVLVRHVAGGQTERVDPARAARLVQGGLCEPDWTDIGALRVLYAAIQTRQAREIAELQAAGAFAGCLRFDAGMPTPLRKRTDRHGWLD